VSLSRGRAGVNVPSPVDARDGRAMKCRMIEDTSAHALDRIERALTRIEAAALRKPGVTGSDPRYLALRSRTQAALASLETVIAQADERH
jgi:hypothetical protein